MEAERGASREPRARRAERERQRRRSRHRRARRTNDARGFRASGRVEENAAIARVAVDACLAREIRIQSSRRAKSSRSRRRARASRSRLRGAASRVIAKRSIDGRSNRSRASRREPGRRKRPEVERPPKCNTKRNTHLVFAVGRFKLTPQCRRASSARRHCAPRPRRAKHEPKTPTRPDASRGARRRGRGVGADDAGDAPSASAPRTTRARAGDDARWRRTSVGRDAGAGDGARTGRRERAVVVARDRRGGIAVDAAAAGAGLSRLLARELPGFLRTGDVHADVDGHRTCGTRRERLFEP